MESLNLNALAGSLPNSNLASAEKELLNNFRAAALSITNLYRSSRSTSKRAYNSGYAAACADLLQMIQQSVSDSETPPSIGRVMDWVEARLEAIRAREEEEDEEDEESAASKKEKEGQGQTGRLKASSSLPRANSAPAVPQQATREQGPLAPSKLSQAITTGPSPPSPSTPPSPPATTLRPLSTPTTTTPASRTLKPRAFAAAIQAKENPHLTSAMTPTTMTMMPPIHHPFPTSPGSPSPFTFTAFPPLPASAAPTDALAIPLPLPLTVSAGAKRRHAMMVLADDSAHGHGPAGVGAGATGTAPSGAAGSSRRRTRSTRGAHQNQHAQDAMEIEEDGRERKRVARR
ncbi:hypothetical protein DFH94DRAFT_780087 [Russula ochroleuca]|uniref:Uncharacterized protein n=1 Tax=Russula ochroleuca TaxID=152965 RepID=A0A9P5ML54_9AGAM|nr:hypothetical protein DFH94DRAFT_780087 [Russula ochroleuca]